MRKPIKILLATTLFGACVAFAVPAAAEQSLLSEIIFGKIYNDDVTAVQLSVHAQHEQQIPLAIAYASRSEMKNARAAISSDPHLMQAIAARGIALHNVVGLKTALNGGHILYYR